MLTSAFTTLTNTKATCINHKITRYLYEISHLLRTSQVQTFLGRFVFKHIMSVPELRHIFKLADIFLKYVAAINFWSRHYGPILPNYFIRKEI